MAGPRADRRQLHPGAGFPLQQGAVPRAHAHHVRAHTHGGAVSRGRGRGTLLVGAGRALLDAGRRGVGVVTAR